MASTPHDTGRTDAPERPSQQFSAPATGTAGTGERPGRAVASLVLGIIGVVLCWIPIIAIILGILAIVFGSMSRNEIRRHHLAGHGQATAGFVLGIAAVILGVALWIVGIAVMSS